MMIITLMVSKNIPSKQNQQVDEEQEHQRFELVKRQEQEFHHSVRHPFK